MFSFFFFFFTNSVSYPLPGPADSGAGKDSAGVRSAESEARGLLLQVGAISDVLLSHKD